LSINATILAAYALFNSVVVSKINVAEVALCGIKAPSGR